MQVGADHLLRPTSECAPPRRGRTSPRPVSRTTGRVPPACACPAARRGRPRTRTARCGGTPPPAARGSPGLRPAPGAGGPGRGGPSPSSDASKDAASFLATLPVHDSVSRVCRFKDSAHVQSERPRDKHYISEEAPVELSTGSVCNRYANDLLYLKQLNVSLRYKRLDFKSGHH